MAEKVLGFRIQIQGTEAAVENATDLKLAISEVNKALKETTDPEEYKRLEKELIRLKASQKEVNAQIRDQVRQQQANLEVTDDSIGAYRKLSAQLGTARQRYKDLAAAGQENNEEAQQQLKIINELDTELKRIDASVGQFQRNVGDYRGAINDTLGAVIPGFNQIQTGLDNISGAASRTGKAIARAFLIFEVVNLLIQGAEQLREFTEEIRIFRGEVETLTGQTGQALDETVSKSRALANTYQEDAKEIALAANTLAREFGISVGDALDRLAEGFSRGADTSGEFLDSVREYSSQVDSVEQLIDVLTLSTQEGIYSDKGIDAVKEFNLRINEQTNATREALINAFGEEFTQGLFDNLNQGAITTTDALKLVVDELNATDVTAQQTGQLLADVFGGPGEDAGERFIRLLGNVQGELSGAQEATTAYAEQQEKLREANLRLEEAQTRVAEALQDSSVEFDVIKANVKAFFIEIAADFLQFVEEFPATLAGWRAALGQIGENIVNFFRATFDRAKIFALQIEKLNPFGRTSEQIQQDIDALRSQITAYGEAGQSAGEAYREAYLSELGNIREQNAGAELVRQTNKQIRDEIKKNPPDPDPDNRLIREKIAEVEQVLTVSSRILAEKSAGIVSQTASAILQNSAEGEFEYLQRIGEKFEQFREEQRQKDIAYKEQVRTSSIDTLQSTVSFISELSAISAQRQQEQFQTQIQQQEEVVNNLEQQEQRATGIRKRQLQQRLAAERSQLDKLNKDREEAELKAAKKSKAINIIQSIINTALAVTKTLASIPFPGNVPAAISVGIQGALQTAIIAAQPLAEGGLIVAPPNIKTLPNGDNILATVRRGEVVLNRQQQAALGGPATFRAIGVPGFALGGVADAPISAPQVNVPSVDRGLAGLKQFIESLDRKTDAINSRIDRLRAFVVSDDVADDLANREALRINATLR